MRKLDERLTSLRLCVMVDVTWGSPQGSQSPQQTQHSQDTQDAVPARGRQEHQDVYDGHEDQHAVQNIPGALEIAVFS